MVGYTVVELIKGKVVTGSRVCLHAFHGFQVSLQISAWMDKWVNEQDNLVRPDVLANLRSRNPASHFTFMPGRESVKDSRNPRVWPERMGV